MLLSGTYTALASTLAGGERPLRVLQDTFQYCRLSLPCGSLIIDMIRWQIPVFQS
jgi:hypothetical protein